MGEVPPCSSKRLIKALKKVGIQTDETSGKGSHTKIIDPKTGHTTTVPESRSLSYVREGIVRWAVQHGYSKKGILENL